MRRATRRDSRQQPAGEISIHALLAESDINTYHRIFGEGISIHALLAESDCVVGAPEGADTGFLSTLSLRRATCFFCVKLLLQLIFLSTLSLRRATMSMMQSMGAILIISIHALLAESDRPAIDVFLAVWSFLSTLSLRRATIGQLQCILGRKYFYPRSPCGERPEYFLAWHCIRADFYPRSPCGERPCRQLIHHLSKYRFLSTLSLRRATIMFAGILSHHAHFYPRSPCGERQPFWPPY